MSSSRRWSTNSKARERRKEFTKDVAGVMVPGSNTHGESAVDIEVTYWGGNRGRKFDILANGQRIASEELKGSKPDKFFAKRYSIPESVLKAASNGRVTVKFVATQWLAGGVYDMRLLRPEK